jgi:pimeloyl-[acyl-carrier protein] methyl ester esterase
LNAGLEILRKTDLRAHLPHIMQPVLLLHGEKDGIVPLIAARYLEDALPQARLDVFVGTAHAPLIAQPLRTAACIMDFCHGT